jgi:hypothetical protein
MIMSTHFKNVQAVAGAIEFNRSGFATKLVLPEALQKRVCYDVSIDAENNRVVFSEGDTVYVIADRFGFLRGKEEEVEANIFFIDGGVVLELVTGKILLQGENGEIYSVNEVGDIDYPTASAKIHWATAKDIFNSNCLVTKYQYNTSDDMSKTYTNNFVYNMYFHYVNTGDKGGNIFKSKVNDYFGDLGLDKIQFLNYAEEGIPTDDDGGHIDVADLEDIDEEEEEDEFPSETEESYEGEF